MNADTLTSEAETTENGVFRDGQTYTIRVTPLTYSTDLEGESAETTFTFLPVAPYSAKNVTASAEGRTVTATWDAPTNNGGAAVENYTYQISDESGVLENGTTTDTTVTLGSLQRYTQYSVVIKAVNYKGESPEATVNVRTLADAPSVPFVSDVQPLSPTSVRLEAVSYTHLTLPTKRIV